MSGTKNDSCLYEFDGFRADPVRRRLSRGGEAVSLTPKAFSILIALLERRGQVVPKEDLIQQIWPDTFVTEANLTQNISSLRKALGERANDPRYVVTIPGQGYSFVADVMELPRTATSEMPMLVLPTPETSAAPIPPASLAFPAFVTTDTDPSELARAALAALSAPEPASSSSPEDVPVRLTEKPTRTPTPPGLPMPPISPASAARPAGAAPPTRDRPRVAVSAALLLLLLAAATTLVLYLFLFRPAPFDLGVSSVSAGSVRPDRQAVAVLGFNNLSGKKEQAWLATALSEMLTTELATGGKVRLISGENVTRARAALSLPEHAHIRTTELERLSSILLADLIVKGDFLERADGQIRLDLQVLKVPSGEEKATLVEMGTESDLFGLVSKTGRDLRNALKWAPPSPAQAREIQALRPASSEATRLYAQGLDKLRAFDARGAEELLSQAADADPKSAVIRSALAQAWADLGYDAHAAEDAERAVELSGSLPKQEQLAIQARYHEAKREWGKASELYRSLWTFFPDDLDYGLRLANVLIEAGLGREAKETVAALRQLPAPKRDDPRIDLAEANVARRLWDAEGALRAAKAAEVKGWKLGESQVVAQALRLEGQSVQISGRLDDAISLFRQAQALFKKSKNQAEEARMLTFIGVTLDLQGRFAEAQEQFEGALTIAQRLGNNYLVATETGNLGLLAHEAGDLGEARILLEKAAVLYKETEDRLLEARTFYFLGRLLADQGDLEGARQRLDRVLAASREIGSRLDEAAALRGFGHLLALEGRLTEARRSQEQALAILETFNDPFRTAGMLTSLAAVTARVGDLEGAERMFQRALASQQRVGLRFGAAQSQGGLAALAYSRGDLARASAASREQLRLAREMKAGLLVAEALQNLGRAELAQGDLAGARQHLEEAQRTADDLGGRLAAVAARVDLARLALLSDRPAEAVRRAREAADWYGQRGMLGAQAWALALVAEGLLRQGQGAAAQGPADQARMLAERGDDSELQILVTTTEARVEAAIGGGREAGDRLRWAVEQAGKFGFVSAGFEARLALAQLQTATLADRRAGQQLLETLRRDAGQRGFKIVVQRAESSLKGLAPPLG
jgi:eukaryotic-like serine/threonine-protein kinase